MQKYEMRDKLNNQTAARLTTRKKRGKLNIPSLYSTCQALLVARQQLSSSSLWSDARLLSLI
jgi:hypothetical protein